MELNEINRPVAPFDLFAYSDTDSANSELQKAAWQLLKLCTEIQYQITNDMKNGEIQDFPPSLMAMVSGTLGVIAYYRQYTLPFLLKTKHDLQNWKL
ncbi:hypothetical protein [Flavipsychrobacter stenotrophus]|nr:hypothetical protein [Flavipsychrobacter stenotrophus]